MLEIKEMTNTEIIRHLIVVERELKTKQIEKKQLQDELNKRFDEGNLD